MKYYTFYNSELNAKLNAIADSRNSTEMHEAITNCMRYIVLHWWNKLDTKYQKAIAMLDFNYSVLSSMMWFTAQFGNMDDYKYIREAIHDAVEKHINNGVVKYYSDGEAYLSFEVSHFVYDIDRAACHLFNAKDREKKIASELDKVFSTYGVSESVKKVTIDSAIRNSTIVNEQKEQCREDISEYRKEFLHAAMDYLRDNYKGE